MLLVPVRQIVAVLEMAGLEGRTYVPTLVCCVELEMMDLNFSLLDNVERKSELDEEERLAIFCLGNDRGGVPWFEVVE